MPTHTPNTITTKHTHAQKKINKHIFLSDLALRRPLTRPCLSHGVFLLVPRPLIPSSCPSSSRSLHDPVDPLVQRYSYRAYNERKRGCRHKHPPPFLRTSPPPPPSRPLFPFLPPSSCVNNLTPPPSHPFLEGPSPSFGLSSPCCLRCHRPLWRYRCRSRPTLSKKCVV